MKKATRKVGFVAALTILSLTSACERQTPTETGVRSPASAVWATGYRYTEIDVPGGAWTQAYRMNARGDVVGSYGANLGTARGFLLRRGEFQSIDVPGATNTYARGINERGDIVGFSVTAGKLSGYLLSAPNALQPPLSQDQPAVEVGTFTTIDYPGSVGTRLWDINAVGDIAGEYQPTAGAAWRGFTLRNGTYTVITVPYANMSAGFGINERGAVVGHYTLPGSKMFGYIFSDGAYMQFNHPSSGTTGMSCAQGIGVHGEVVGHYLDPVSNVVYGYLWADGAFVAQMQVPGALQTYPLSITPGGVIVGYHADASSAWHGFIAEPLNPPRR